MDLDLWDCFGRKNLHLITKEIQYVQLYNIYFDIVGLGMLEGNRVAVRFKETSVFNLHTKEARDLESILKSAVNIDFTINLMKV